MKTQTVPHFIIIDDDNINNHICRKSIEIMFPDADIQTFTEPQAGLDYILSVYPVQNSKETYLFLDINMPVLSGWDVLYTFLKFPEEIKQQFRIYILSSSVDIEDKQKAEKCHLVIDFIEKPLNVTQLQEIFPGKIIPPYNNEQ